MIRGYEVVASDLTLNTSETSLTDRYYYYNQDEQGSTLYITSEEQVIENSYTYDAFGNLLTREESKPNRITYTGQQYDAIPHQYYLRARYYNPIIGRFTQEDVYRGDGLNLYAYCGNNPVNYYDPSGYNGCKSKEQQMASAGNDSNAQSKRVIEAGEENYVLFNKTHKGSAPIPKGTGPNGGKLQSHHGLQQQWAKENLAQYGYDPDLAPTVTIETGKGMPHTSISNAQNVRRNTRVANGNGKWSSSLQDELQYIVDDFINSGFSKNTINNVLEQQYKMLDKLRVPYERIGIR